MNQPVPNENNQPSTPEIDIRQQVDFSPFDDGMQAAEGNNNIQVQDDNQAIAQMSSGTAFSTVEGSISIIYNYYYHRESIGSEYVESTGAAGDENLPCPYRGLYHFSPDNAEYFFGREIFIKELFDATETHKFIPVLGASGSGKSSVVLAGLVPRLQQEGHWLFTHFRPGSDPFHALALALIPLYTPDLNTTERIAQARQLSGHFREGTIPLADVFAQIHQNHPTYRVLLIADQFEELYTLCGDQKIRRSFLDTLLASFKTSPSQSQYNHVLVATMRADFLGNALSYPPFGDLLRNADIKIRSMKHEELLQVIEKPAQKLGVTFEAGLVERILDNVDSEPGNLPLLEFALTKLWERRRGKQLTHAAYQDIGGVQGALARHADHNYGNLSATEKEQVRRIFIQLVRPGEEREDTRRLITKDELSKKSWGLVKQLRNARLVVTSRNAANQETVEVVHETLIHNWGEFRKWIDKYRSFRAWQERLRIQLYQWKQTQRDERAFLRGVPLAEAEEKLKEHRNDLSQDEQDFIQQSLALQDCLLKEEEERKQKEEERKFRELQQARKIAFGASVIGSFLTVLSISTFAFFQWQDSQKNSIIALIKVAEAHLTSDNQLDAMFEVLKAGKKLDRLLIGKNDISDQVKEALQQVFYGTQRRFGSVVFSPDSKLATENSEERAQSWDSRGKELAVLLYKKNQEYETAKSVVFSLNGKQLTILDSEGRVRLWDSRGKELAVLPHKKNEKYGTVKSVVFSPNGKQLATVDSGGTVRLWDSRGKEFALLSYKKNVKSVVFSPDGKLLATVGYGETRLWNSRGKELAVLRGHIGRVYKVVFSPDGKLLATGGEDGTVRLWDSRGKELAVLMEHNGSVKSLAFSPDGKQLATWDEYGVRLWDSRGKKFAFLLHNGYKYGGNDKSIVFSPDGKLLATVDSSYRGKTKLWDYRGKKFAFLPGNRYVDVKSVAFSPDGNQLATVDSGGTVRLWDSRGNELALPSDKKNVRSVVFSPDSKLLATVGYREIELWDSQGKKLALLLNKRDEEYGSLESVVFSPDGKLLATVVESKFKTKAVAVRLWQVGGMEEMLALTCNWVRGYLKNNVNVSEEDRHLCDGISSK